MAEDRHAISPTRAENYPEWYQQVIRAADLAENSAVRGCMVIKPWGYGLWENIQREFDRLIKETGHENAYFPLFIPLSYLEKEAAHVEGFAKECAVVTHHRLEVKNGKLIPTGELEEPLIVRPTSETIIGESFSRWIRSYRDLPLLINQWANVVRWEMRPRLFLRTAEFLWQEGHTAHATEDEARSEVRQILLLYKRFVEESLAMPVIAGEKPEGERFPGAVNTYSIEAMMQDGKALQAGTSHYLGQNFARASNIRFLNHLGSLEYVHTTSWGISTRLIGGLIMTHSDDDGLRVPPRIAPKHVAILPVIPNPEAESEVMDYVNNIAESLRGINYHLYPLVVTVDRRDLRGGEKSWQWIKKGIPLRIEVGPKDLKQNQVTIYRRDRHPKEREVLSKTDLPGRVCQLLDEIQSSYYTQAVEFRENRTERSVSNYSEFKELFSKDHDSQSGEGGFIIAPWCGDDQLSAPYLNELKVTVRCLPLEQQERPSGNCVLTGKPALYEAVFAQAY